MSKDTKTGGFFNMEDGESRQNMTPQSRKELSNLRSQFMGRARQFIDDTAIGEGRKVLQKWVDKVQGVEEQAPNEEDEEAWEGEMLADDAPEVPLEPQTRYAQPTDADFEDDFEENEYDASESNEELDWTRPEYIKAGYAKPGTKHERAKTLEEAQDESFTLKMGNLSGLLSRFGSEDASPETPTHHSARHRLEMNKPLFREQMATLYAEFNRQADADIEPRLWLHPEVITLLRAANTPQRILLFVMAALFVTTEENYLTEADQDWIRELMTRAGFMLEAKEIQRVVEQTFVFPERVHRLYESLLTEPPVLHAKHIEQYRENLSKMYIYEVASRYDADPANVIRTLASHWQDAAADLQQAWKEVTPIAEQYERFLQRKMASATIYQKLRSAQEKVFAAHEKMQAIAREVEGLKQVTRLIEEEDALSRLGQFRSERVLPVAECIGSQAISLYDLREQFVSAQIQALATAMPVAYIELAVELSPVEQKHAISRAKEGEIKSLKLIENYKAWRIQQVAQNAGKSEAPEKKAPVAKADVAAEPVVELEAVALTKGEMEAEALSKTEALSEAISEALNGEPESVAEEDGK